MATFAIIAGCAFASAGNLAWFAFWGVVGVLSLGRGASLLRRAHEVSRRIVAPDLADGPRRAAA